MTLVALCHYSCYGKDAVNFKMYSKCGVGGDVRDSNSTSGCVFALVN
jgi:hypothetical protein